MEDEGSFMIIFLACLVTASLVLVCHYAFFHDTSDDTDDEWDELNEKGGYVYSVTGDVYYASAGTVSVDDDNVRFIYPSPYRNSQKYDREIIINMDKIEHIEYRHQFD